MGRFVFFEHREKLYVHYEKIRGEPHKVSRDIFSRAKRIWSIDDDENVSIHKGSFTREHADMVLPLLLLKAKNI